MALATLGAADRARLEAALIRWCKLELDSDGKPQPVISSADRWSVLGSILSAADIDGVRRRAITLPKERPNLMSASGHFHVHVFAVLLWLAGFKVDTDHWEAIAATVAAAPLEFVVQSSSPSSAAASICNLEAATSTALVPSSSSQVH